MNFKFKLILIIAVVILLIWLFLRFQNNALQVSRFIINVPDTAGVRIVHLSDLHGKQFGKNNSELIEKIDEQQPHLIVMTGDILGADCKNYSEVMLMIEQLAEKYPTYYVSGNHEKRSGRYTEIMADAAQAGATVLANEIITAEINGERINLLGIDTNQGTYKSYMDAAKGKPTYADSSELLTRLEQEEGIKLVLCHFPENFALMEEFSYNQYDFDIMFSGHAHGGQFILPFVGGVLAPGQGLFPKYYSGVYGSESKMVVSRGLGNSSFPFRLFNRPEIVVVDVQSVEKVAQP